MAPFCTQTILFQAWRTCPSGLIVCNTFMSALVALTTTNVVSLLSALDSIHKYLPELQTLEAKVPLRASEDPSLRSMTAPSGWFITIVGNKVLPSTGTTSSTAVNTFHVFAWLERNGTIGYSTVSSIRFPLRSASSHDRATESLFGTPRNSE